VSRTTVERHPCPSTSELGGYLPGAPSAEYSSRCRVASRLSTPIVALGCDAGSLRLPTGISVPPRDACHESTTTCRICKVHPPHGPHKIATNGQVVVPKDVLAAAGLAAGDLVYVQATDDPPGAVLVIPVDVAARWFEAGKGREAAPE